jgi:hypothetical protein
MAVLETLTTSLAGVVETACRFIIETFGLRRRHAAALRKEAANRLAMELLTRQLAAYEAMWCALAPGARRRIERGVLVSTANKPSLVLSSVATLYENAIGVVHSAHGLYLSNIVRDVLWELLDYLERETPLSAEPQPEPQTQLGPHLSRHVDNRVQNIRKALRAGLCVEDRIAAQQGKTPAAPQ